MRHLQGREGENGRGCTLIWCYSEPWTNTGLITLNVLVINVLGCNAHNFSCKPTLLPIVLFLLYLQCNPLYFLFTYPPLHSFFSTYNLLHSISYLPNALPLQAEVLTKRKVKTVQDASEAGRLLLARGCGSVIITLGEEGAVFCQDGHEDIHVPAESVTPVDTTVSTYMNCLIYQFSSFLFSSLSFISRCIFCLF